MKNPIFGLSWPDFYKWQGLRSLQSSVAVLYGTDEEFLYEDQMA